MTLAGQDKLMRVTKPSQMRDPRVRLYWMRRFMAMPAILLAWEAELDMERGEDGA